jgi:hypothetical protein
MSEEPRRSKGFPNAIACHAIKKDGEPCQNPAIAGATVCRTHGGSAGQVKRKARLRLMELVDPAVATLAREMANADTSRDRQSAANSVLDRSGLGRQQILTVDADELREVIRERARELRQQAIAELEASGDIIEGEIVEEAG